MPKKNPSRKNLYKNVHKKTGYVGSLGDLVESVTTKDDEDTEPKQRFSVEIPKSLHTKFKIITAAKNTKMLSEIIKILGEYVEKNKHCLKI